MPTPERTAAVPSEIFRQELDRVLDSQTFATAGRLRDLLVFLYKRLGETGELPKEHEIGIRVFRRPPDFDPSVDSVVRVYASRLRNKLKEFYETERGPCEFQIDLPRGAYVLELVPNPTWIPASGTVADITRESAPASPSDTSPLSRNRILIVVAAVLAGIVLWVFLRGQQSAAPRNAELVRITGPGYLAGPGKFSFDGKSIYIGLETLGQKAHPIYELSVADRSQQPRRLGYEGLKLHSVSAAGLTLIEPSTEPNLWVAAGAGKPPEFAAKGIRLARFDRDGRRMLVTRVNTQFDWTLEYPAGTVLASARGNLGVPFQFATQSPSGRWIAYGRSSGRGKDYELCVMDVATRTVRTLLSDFVTFGPIAFLSDTELVTGGARRGENPRVYGVHPGNGTRRVIHESTHPMIVDDARSDGLILLREIVEIAEVTARLPGGSENPSRLALGPFQIVEWMSRDGKRLAISEPDPLDAENDTIYLLDTAKSPSVLRKVATGITPVLSPDGQKMLVVKPKGPERGLELVDLNDLSTSLIGAKGYSYRGLIWSNSGDSFLFTRVDVASGQPPPAVFRQSLRTGSIEPFAPGTYYQDLGNGQTAYQLRDDLFVGGAGKLASPVGDRALKDVILSHWLPSIGRLAAYKPPTGLETTVPFFLIDPATGSRQALRVIEASPGTVFHYPVDVMSADGKYFAYTVTRETRTAYLLRDPGR